MAGIALVSLLFFTPSPQAGSAPREDSASLVFEKTAGRHETRVHVVKKGEWIAGIFRSQQGDEPVPYALIRQLNPNIRDMNRLRVGQRVVLPVRVSTASADQDVSEQAATYRTREGDSITRVLLEEVRVEPQDALRAFRLIRRLNPGMTDPSHLPPGQDIKLPREWVQKLPQDADPTRADTPPVSPQKAELLETVVLSLENPGGETAKKHTATEPLLGFIRPVISRMGGSVTAAGNYYIPLKDGAQITIDCSLLPVVELDDGSTILLDFANRLSDGILGTIRQTWPQTAVVSSEPLRDQLAALAAIIGHSRNYTMSRAVRPLTISQKPELQAFPDWIIAAKREIGGTLHRQGLFLLTGAEKPLPPLVRTLMESCGLTVTEIADSRVNLSLPEPVPQPPAVADLRGLKGVALAGQLLRLLGETPEAATEVLLFDQARDGFNLAVTADLLVRKGEKKILLLKNRLPDQFIGILKEGGTEVITVGETDGGRPLIEAVLRGIGLPISLGYFSFRIPADESPLRLSASFSALWTTVAKEPLFLVDFDMPAELISLLRERKAGRIARY
jgi:hypothetical protein